MFKFQAEWPSWVPWLGGKDVFPAIWNLADASITLGVIMVFFRQRKYFPKEKKEVDAPAPVTPDGEVVESVVSDDGSEE